MIVLRHQTKLIDFSIGNAIVDYSASNHCNASAFNARKPNYV